MSLNYRITNVYARGPEVVVKAAYWDSDTKTDVETMEFPYPGDAFDDKQLHLDIIAFGQALEANSDTALKQAAELAVKLASYLVNEEGPIT